ADGRSHDLQAPNVWTAGTVHHVAMVLHADTVTLYYDGTAVASSSVPGLRLRQEAHEEVVIGGGAGPFPYGGLFFAARQMDAVDSVRLSNIARYTSDFSGSVPARKFDAAGDAHTLLLLNFDNMDPNFVVAATSGLPAYLTLRSPDPAWPFRQIGGNSVRNLTI